MNRTSKIDEYLAKSDDILNQDIFGSRKIGGLNQKMTPPQGKITVLRVKEEISQIASAMTVLGSKVSPKIDLPPVTDISEYKPEFARLNLMYFLGLAGVQTRESGNATMMFSWLNAAFPDLLAALELAAVANTDVAFVDLGDEECYALSVGRLYEKGVLSSYIDQLPATITQEHLQKIDAYGYLAVHLFAIGKPVTTQNITAFTQNRPRAIYGKAGVALGKDNIFTRFPPTIQKLHSITGYFNMHPKVRHVLVKELISWVGNTTNSEQEAVTTQIKLWHGSGFTHVALIKNLLTNYREVVVEMPGLRAEIAAFLAEYSKHTSQQSSVLAYGKVLQGDSLEVLRQQNYPELFKLAHEIAKRTDKKFSRFATASEDSIWIHDFETKYEQKFGSPLPHIIASDADMSHA